MSKISLKTEFVRFDSLYCNVPDTSFYSLRNQFAAFFNLQVSDTIFIQKKNHASYQRLCNELQSVALQHDMNSPVEDVLKHLKYYSGVAIDSVVYLNSDFDHKTPTFWLHNTVMIASDMFIGEHHSVYKARMLPDYLVRTYNVEYIPVKLAKEIGSKIVSPPINNIPSFVEKMIWHGKQQYFARQLVPKVSDSVFWETEQRKLNFVNDNLRTIWNFWIEKNYLYSKSSELDRRFLDLAPFSKFYANIDRFTPGGVGKIVGFQIVKSYVEHNDISDQDLLEFLNQEANALQFLQQSNFKPY